MKGIRRARALQLRGGSKEGATAQLVEVAPICITDQSVGPVFAPSTVCLPSISGRALRSSAQLSAADSALLCASPPP